VRNYSYAAKAPGPYGGKWFVFHFCKCEFNEWLMSFVNNGGKCRVFHVVP